MQKVKLLSVTSKRAYGFGHAVRSQSCSRATVPSMSAPKSSASLKSGFRLHQHAAADSDAVRWPPALDAGALNIRRLK